MRTVSNNGWLAAVMFAALAWLCPGPLWAQALPGKISGALGADAAGAATATAAAPRIGAITGPLPAGWNQTVLGEYAAGSTALRAAPPARSPAAGNGRAGRGEAAAPNPVEARLTSTNTAARSATGNGAHYAAVMKIENGKAVVLDGKEGPAYEMVFDLQFSADGRQYAYAVNQGANGFVVRDGTAGAPGPRLVPQSLRLSPDGARTAYAVEAGGKMQVVSGGKTGRAYDEIQAHGIVFSPQGNQFAYPARQGETWTVVAEDGRTSPAYANISGLTLSPDGSRIAFIGLSRNQTVAVVDGKAGPSYDHIFNLAFTPDGKSFSYVALRGGKASIVWNGAAASAVDEILPPGLMLSADGQKKVYVARVGNVWRVMEGAKAGPDFDSVMRGTHRPFETQPAYLRVNQPRPSFYPLTDPVVFSADGARMAYGAKQGAQAFIYLDGARLPAFAAVSNPLFSADGKHFAYIARAQARDLVMHDGQPSPEFERIVSGSLMFSPDGARLAFVTERTQPDETSSSRTTELQTVVVNGVAGPTTLSILSGPVWRDNGTLEYLAPVPVADSPATNLVRFTYTPPPP